MKKLIIILTMVLFVGCATTQTPSYVPPYSLLNRFITIAQEVHKHTAPDLSFAVRIVQTKEPNAWMLDNKIYLSDTMFYLSDNTLKFIIAHEMSHAKLRHLQERKNVKYITTGVMLIINAVVPGAGALGQVVHPLTQATYSKPQELEADLEAYKACLCMGMTKEEVIEIMETLMGGTEGGLFSHHPSGKDRIENIRNH